MLDFPASPFTYSTVEFFRQARGFKQVSEQDFDRFISNLSAGHTVDVSYSVEPPIKSWNDFSDGTRWPHSVVAFQRLTPLPEYFIPEWARLEPKD
ncbi:MAG: hypothetical protein CMN76_13275 [Spirochaetaceae bacterium]|nr:hypothetical protein [Spirochaetaceae bacterium]|tara:strand:+ start:19692 stop:19976 length:285 start_codon:yes stop_codon:yes gene_type:complete